MTMKQRMARLAPAVALMMLVSAPAASRALGLGNSSTREAIPALASTYHLSLESAWPQYGAPESACRNGGDEIVRGLLTRRPDGTYQGTLDRSTLLFFCGEHGASGQPCVLVLEGDGPVSARGFVVTDPTSPSRSALHLSWTPRSGHLAEVEGACSEDFKRSARTMYLEVRHGVEFALPVKGGELRGRLENYPWTVVVQ
jgi:hypothetical protein